MSGALNLKEAKALALDFLDRDDPQTAIGCVIRFITPEILLEDRELPVALVQVMSVCTVARARALIMRLPDSEEATP